jgi:anthranilate phosphoribosyltransferase
MEEILAGADAHQVSAFLMLLRAKGESADELMGIVQAMREAMVPVPVEHPVLDIVGTGGDGMHTLNISTGSALLAASCGVKIAKHGTRSVSSLCGSADVLEALGITVEQDADEIVDCIENVGIGFMYAPHFHPAFKSLGTIRKGLKMRTVMNLIGPLLNPASAEFQMIGVFHENLLERMALTLFKLGTKHSIVFHGCGLDELSCVGPSQAIEVTPNGLRRFILDPQEFGLSLCSIEDLKGHDAQYNAAALQRAFEGEPGPLADTLTLNAGVALYLYGTTPSIQDGIDLAREHLHNKKVMKLLNQWRNYV